jgi:hypothetical protein
MNQQQKKVIICWVNFLKYVLKIIYRPERNVIQTQVKRKFIFYNETPDKRLSLSNRYKHTYLPVPEHHVNLA